MGASILWSYIELFGNHRISGLICVESVTGTVYWHGSAWVGENIPGAKTVFFEESGHMLFWEEPGRFNRKVAEFVQEH